MPYVLPNQRRVSPDSAFEHNGVQHARGWLRRASQAELDALGVTWEDPPAPSLLTAPTTADIRRAHDAHLGHGVMISVTGYADPIHVQCAGNHRDNLQDLYEMARERVTLGQGTMTSFRCAANNNHNLNPAQVKELCEQVFAYRNDVREAAHVLKDMNPIPTDYATNPAHWPSNGL